MSGCRRQISLVIIAPHIVMAIIDGAIFLFILGNKKENRINPYLPSFNSSPARIMDPATGASTWAFGSHRCSRYIGIFAKNDIIVIVHHRKNIICWVGAVKNGLNKNSEQVLLKIVVILISRGREAATVYSIRYIPACSRSGW